MRVALAFLMVAIGVRGLVAQEKAATAPAFRAVVEVEEDVYKYAPPGNGSGPMWCSGSTCLVRIGDDVFASGQETLKDFKPLNNCRWTLYKRGADGWQLQQADPTGRTREPCPLVAAGGKLLLSANPTLTDPSAVSGPARPEIVRFSAGDPKAPFETIRPAWDGKPAFTEHSYRTFAADGSTGSVILFQNIGHTHSEWAFCDGSGRGSACGKLVNPWGAEYDTPQPIRVCYPDVMLRGRAVHFCGVSDITEPYRKWRDFKFGLTHQKWDYDFRRLFYTWTDDITSGKFHPWVEIASRDKTCGWMAPGDLWLAPDGRVHILWIERALDLRLRKEFFPEEKQSTSLGYAIVQAGKVVSRQVLLKADEGGASEIPSRGRFHVTPDGRLFAIFFVSGRNASGKAVSENRLVELGHDGPVGPAVRVPLKVPMSEFFTATVRGGSLPSTILDLLGLRAGASTTISYARIRLVLGKGSGEK